MRSFFSLRSDLPRIVPLMRHPNVPLWAKGAAIAVAVLIISPLNVLGDIPFLGFLDDAALLGLLVHFFVSFAQQRIVAEEKNVTPVRSF